MRKTIVAIFDDLDGTRLAEDAVRVRSLIIDGTEYTLEVGQANSDRLDIALAPFLKAAGGQGSEPAPAAELAPAEPSAVLWPAVPARPAAPSQPAAETVAPAAETVAPAAETVTPAAETVTAEAAAAEPAAPEPTPEPAAQPARLAANGKTPLRNCQEAQVAYFGRVTVPRSECQWDGLNSRGLPTDSRGQKAHLRLAHGLGGVSAANMNKAWREDEARKKAERAKAAEVTAQMRQQVADRKAEAAQSAAPATPAGLVPFKRADRPGLPKVTVTTLKPAQTIVPGVNIIPAGPKEARPGGMLKSPEAPVTRPFGERTEEVSLKATELADRWKAGIPEHIQFSYHPDVLALYGMDKELMDAAVRNPEWVEIAPDTFVKGYTVLRFHRGDAQAVMGCRNPESPLLIAAYHGSLLEHDVHRVNHTGGGGRRRVPSGLPKTPRQSINYLLAAGAEVSWDEAADVSSVPVTFAGQDLGRITVGTVPRSQVETDYQRTLRKIAGIKLRNETKQSAAG